MVGRWSGGLRAQIAPGRIGQVMPAAAAFTADAVGQFDRTDWLRGGTGRARPLPRCRAPDRGAQGLGATAASRISGLAKRRARPGLGADVRTTASAHDHGRHRRLHVAAQGATTSSRNPSPGRQRARSAISPPPSPAIRSSYTLPSGAVVAEPIAACIGMSERDGAASLASWCQLGTTARRRWWRRPRRPT